ncbi:MAG: ABC transporter substrate-binding protein [Lachnospiraceae bacterium]|nr:ABC transporter substrate-binding protein [Lachnospiraceae bacterium]
MKNVTKKLWAFLLCFGMLAGMAACGKGVDGEEPTPSPVVGATQTPKATPTIEPEIGSADVDLPYSVTLPDKTVLELAGIPQRIVSMGPNITDMLFALGAGERVVGRTDYCDTPAETANIPSVGTISKPDIEAILALEPDLIIGSIHFSEETRKQLKDLGIPVAVLYDSKNMDGVYDMIRALGELTGQKEAGDTLAEQAEQTVNDTIAKYSGEEYADFEAPTVYYVVGFGEYGDYTAGGSTFIGQLLTAAGGKNIAQEVEGWMIDHETLLEADPQIIIIGEGQAESFCATPGYEELSAVKNNMVVEFDTYHMLDRQSHKNAEIFVQLAELFHTQPMQ